MSSGKEQKDTTTTEKEEAKKQAERIATLADDKDVRKEAAKVADKLENAIEEESRSENTHYIPIANGYQEETIKVARVIAENYIESQREIFNSYQSLWVPYTKNTNGLLWNHRMLPRGITETYTNMVSGFANITIAATRLVNKMISANMDAFKITVEQAKDSSKELLRMGANSSSWW
jgi:hypothetical protein